MASILKCDTRNFDRAIDAIANYSGAPLKDVVDHEAGKILEATIKFTSAASVSNIRASTEERVLTAQPTDLYQPTSASGIRDRAQARRTKNGKIIYFLNNRYPDQLWSQIAHARKASLQRKLRARGLAKHSWYVLAQKAGLRVSAPGYVQKAVATTGKDYPADAAVMRQTGNGTYGIHFSNSQPTVRFAGGNHALERAVSGRTKFFDTNMARGVFSDLKKIARAYPGLTIKA